jgi:hypothetical protein
MIRSKVILIFVLFLEEEKKYTYVLAYRTVRRKFVRTFGDNFSHSIDFTGLNDTPHNLEDNDQRKDTVKFTRVVHGFVLVLAYIDCIVIRMLDRSSLLRPMIHYLDREVRDMHVYLDDLWQHRQCNP